MEPMTKTDALALLGGTVGAAARELDVSYQAVDKWPDVLPRRIEDRVLAVLARRHLPESLLRPRRGAGGDDHGATLPLAPTAATTSQTTGGPI